MARLLLLVLLASGFAGAPARADCTCRLMGESVELGTVACLASPQGHQLARCEMALNVTNWTFLGESCTTSGLIHRERFATALAYDHARPAPSISVPD